LVPSLLNSLQYTEEDLLNQEEERQEIAKSYKDSEIFISESLLKFK